MKYNTQTNTVEWVYFGQKRYRVFYREDKFTDTEKEKVDYKSIPSTPIFYNPDGLKYRNVYHLQEGTIQIVDVGRSELDSINVTAVQCTDELASITYCKATAQTCGTRDCGMVVNLTGESLSVDEIRGLALSINQQYKENRPDSNGKLISKIYISLNTTEQQNEVLGFLSQQTGDFITMWIEMEPGTGTSTDFHLTSNSGFYMGSTLMTHTDAQEPDKHFVALQLINQALRDINNDVDHYLKIGLTPVTKILQGLAAIIGKANLPSKYYDCSSPEYNPILFKIFNLASTVTLSNIFDTGANSLLQDYWLHEFPNIPFPGGSSSSNLVSQLKFAILAGAYNELILTVQDVPLMMDMLVRIVRFQVNAPFELAAFITDPDFTANISQALSKESFIAIGNILNDVGDQAWQELKALHNPAKPCVFAHTLGREVVFVLSFFVGVGELKLMAKGVMNLGRTVAQKIVPRLNQMHWVREISGTAQKLTFLVMLNSATPALPNFNTINQFADRIEMLVDLLPNQTAQQAAETFVHAADAAQPMTWVLRDANGMELHRLTKEGDNLKTLHVVDAANPAQAFQMPVRVVNYHSYAQHVESSTNTIPYLPILIALPGNGDPDNPCNAVCPTRPAHVKNKLKLVCDRAGGGPASIAGINKLCATPALTDSKLIGIANELLLPAWTPEQARDFLSDVATVTTATSHVANNVGALDVGLARAWNPLFKTLIRVEVSWLTRVNSWMYEGLRLNAVGDDVKIKNAGTEIGLIRNNTLLATNYSSGFSGTPVGDAVNGCRVFKNGSQIFVKRVPDLSGLTQLEENYLTISHLAHCTEKHGADVTDEALKYRTQTGIAPNGELGNPVSGTRFYSNTEIKTCISQLGPGTPVFNANLNSSNDRSIIIKYKS